jgi:hypothetical protein
MPIEIRELVIKATVNQEPSGNGNSSAGSGNSAASTEEIISLCVEKVLAIIKDKHER